MKIHIGQTVHFYGLTLNNTLQILKGTVRRDYGFEIGVEVGGFNYRVGRNEINTKKELKRLPIFFGRFTLMRWAAKAREVNNPLVTARVKGLADYWRSLVVNNAENWQQNRRQIKRQKEQIAFVDAL